MENQAGLDGYRALRGQKREKFSVIHLNTQHSAPEEFLAQHKRNNKGKKNGEQKFAFSPIPKHNFSFMKSLLKEVETGDGCERKSGC